MYTQYYGIPFPTGILCDLEKGNSLRILKFEGGQIHDYKGIFLLDTTQECITSPVTGMFVQSVWRQ